MGALLISSESTAKPMLWTLYKDVDLSPQQFVKFINEDLFKHLRAMQTPFQFMITDMDRRSPDAVVLLPVESGLRHEKYLSDEAKAYVVEPLTGDLELLKAVELHPEFKDWVTGATHVTIYGEATDLKALTVAFKALDVQDAVLLVGPKWVLEIRSVKDKSDLFKKLPLTILQHSKLKSGDIKNLSLSLNLGDGLNFSY